MDLKLNTKTARGYRKVMRGSFCCVVAVIAFSLAQQQGELVAQKPRRIPVAPMPGPVQKPFRIPVAPGAGPAQKLFRPVAPMPGVVNPFRPVAPTPALVKPFRPVRGNVQIVRQQVVNLNSNTQVASKSGALLKTDPELEAILEKAERFRTEGQYSIAAKLWQSVLERSGDTLYSADGQAYYSLSRQVEQILAQLPVDEGLSVYRITADANAKEVMAEAESPFDEQALKKIVRNYFLSSLGDDAAMTLSSIYMDKHDFVGAFRMLQKILDSYPDPTVSLVNVHTRLSLCQAMMGETKAAQAAIASARALGEGGGDAKSREQLAAVEKSISQWNGQQRTSRRLKAGFEISLANRNRTGVMPSLPARYMANDLQAVWQYHFEPKESRFSRVKKIKPKFGDDVLAKIKETDSSFEQTMTGRWRACGWRPAGDLLFDKNNVYFKTAIDLAVWDRSADSDQVVWRPLWQNKYQPDAQSKGLSEARRQMNRSRRQTKDHEKQPRELHEFQLFKDRIASQMSIQNGVLYSIEGSRSEVNVTTDPRQRMLQQMRVPVYTRRSRTNQLSAYDVNSGKMLWSLPPIDPEASGLYSDPMEKKDEAASVLLPGDDGEESPWLMNGGFMAAPISYAGLVIVPVNHGGSISIYALDPLEQGKTVWKSYLCDESDAGANPHAPINLSIDGSDLFASCGLGVVFILDPTTGLIRFAKRYERVGKTEYTQGRFGRQQPRMTFNSWSTDTVIAYGRQMICFSSDAGRIEAHNRNTGEIIWYNSTQPLEAHVDYLLGVYDGMLYAAGPQTILAFDLDKEGRMVWGGRVMFNGDVSRGRGMLTADGIYIPVEDSILKFSLKGKNKQVEQIGEVKVNLGVDTPVGNLYSDGEKIWVLGPNRVFALGELKPEAARKNKDTK